MLIIMLSCITVQIMAMDQSEIRPLSTFEWLFGYRTYTPEEQKFVNFFTTLEPKTSTIIDKWFRTTYKNDTDRKKKAEEIVKFIEIKNLEKTFPALYGTARGILTIQSINPEDREALEGHMRGEIRKAPPSMTKENIKKGIYPGISISKKISLK
jgi:hypothetical protein